MLRVAVEHSTDTATLYCVGRIVAGAEADVLKDAVMCQAHQHVVILDLAEVEIIDARGLGVLVFLQTLACVVGFDLKLMHPNDRIRELLALTKLDSFFQIVPHFLEPRLRQDTGTMNMPAPALTANNNS